LRRTKMQRVILVGLIGLATLILAAFAVACEEEDDDSGGGAATATTVPEATPTASSTQTGAEGDICSGLASLDTSVTALSTALSDPNSTVEDVRAAYDGVESAHASIQSAATAVQDERTANVDAAQADLQAAMEALPDTATLDEAVTAIQPQVDALATATADALSGFDC
jgi:hypothetical protein